MASLLTQVRGDLKSQLKAIDLPILRGWIRAYFRWRYRSTELRRYRQWISDGRHPPPPPFFKHTLVRSTAVRFGLNVLIESGTFEGSLIEAVDHDFRKIYTMELDPRLAEAASKRFRHQPHISVRCGDSASLLPLVLKELEEPALLWLDAHYSGGPTARGDTETAVMGELRAIRMHAGHERHVLLLDDAREFTGGGYPTLRQLREWSMDAGFDTMQVEDDVILICSLRHHPGALDSQTIDRQ